MAAVDCAAGILRAVGRRRRKESVWVCRQLPQPGTVPPVRMEKGCRARRQTTSTTAIGKLGKEVLLPTQCTFSLLTLHSSQPPDGKSVSEHLSPQLCPGYCAAPPPARAAALVPAHTGHTHHTAALSTLCSFSRSKLQLRRQFLRPAATARPNPGPLSCGGNYDVIFLCGERRQRWVLIHFVFFAAMYAHFYTILGGEV